MELLMTLGIILWGAITVASLTADVIMYKKLKKYEIKVIEVYDDLIQIMVTINKIDSERIFETDDEVGIAFIKIKDTINSLQKFVVIDEDLSIK